MEHRESIDKLYANILHLESVLKNSKQSFYHLMCNEHFINPEANSARWAFKRNTYITDTHLVWLRNLIPWRTMFIIERNWENVDERPHMQYWYWWREFYSGWNDFFAKQYLQICYSLENWESLSIGHYSDQTDPIYTNEKEARKHEKTFYIGKPLTWKRYKDLFIKLWDPKSVYHEDNLINKRLPVVELTLQNWNLVDADQRKQTLLSTCSSSVEKIINTLT